MGNYHVICMDINDEFFPFRNCIFVLCIENQFIFMIFLVLSAYNSRDGRIIVSSTLQNYVGYLLLYEKLNG